MRVLQLKARIIIAVIAVVVLVLSCLVGIVVVMIVGSADDDGGGTALGSVCGVTTVSAPSASGSTRQQQIQNAKAIDATAQKLGLPGAASRIAIIAAIGESSLINITYGDNATNPDGTTADSLGLFQQQPSQGWGTKEQVLDPTYATTSFLIGKQHDRKGGLVAVPGWEKLQPTIAIHKVQINADPNHYARYYAQADEIIAAAGINVTRGGTDAQLAGDTTAGAGCSVSADGQAVAKELVTYMQLGKLSQLAGYGDIMGQIKNVAAGKSVPNCGVDTRILQVIQIAVQKFGSAVLSSLNRRCTGVIAGAGTNSAHYVNGGGHAVDFANLGSTRTTGGDPNSITLIKALDPIMPAGSGVGQVQCRSAVTLPHLTQFDDSCTHQHVQVNPTSTAPMNLANAGSA